MAAVAGGPAGLRVVRPRPVLSLAIEGASRGGAPVLGPIRLEVEEGETVAITGPSGVGKTTLLRVVAGFERARGEARVEGPVAMVFQEPTLLPWRSARDNLRITARIGAEEADRWLERVGLAGLGRRRPNAMSLGQQRRLSLARAFAARPRLLLMDEPFVSLDAPTAEAMMDLFARLRRGSGAATLLVTHAEAEAKRLATRIVTLGGRPATVVADRQNMGLYRHSSASGVASSGS